MKCLFAPLLVVLLLAAAADAGGYRSPAGYHAPRASRCTSCARSADGRIKRSQSARAQFKKQSPCPATGKRSGPCPGYVIDHVKPLKRGGPDTPSNMQWQTKAAAKAKDRYE